MLFYFMHSASNQNAFYIITPDMNKCPFILLLLLIANAAFAQKDKDSVINNLPMVNGRLIYADRIAVKGHSKAKLDSIAKKWITVYFKYYRPDTLAKDKNANASVLSQGILEYHVTPGLISIPFYAIVTIEITCRDNTYNYKMYDIYFRTKSKLIGSMYQRDPEYLIGLYKQKHISFPTSMSIDRGMIRKYLTAMNSAVRDCILSLNKAMAN